MALKGSPVPPKDQFTAEPSSFAKQSRKSSLAKLMTLEVTVLSAEEVVTGWLWRRPLDRDAYAAVKTDSSAARTGVNDEDGDCNGYPYWGEAMRVTVPVQSRTIEVEIVRQRDGGREEYVAVAIVPIADFSGGPPGHLHCLSYRLFDTGSMIKFRNGIVNITVRRLDGAQANATAGKGKARRAAEDASSGTGDSCCRGVAKEGKVTNAAAAPLADAVMGYPVEVSAAAQVNGKSVYRSI